EVSWLPGAAIGGGPDGPLDAPGRTCAAAGSTGSSCDQSSRPAIEYSTSSSPDGSRNTSWLGPATHAATLPRAFGVSGVGRAGGPGSDGVDCGGLKPGCFFILTVSKKACSAMDCGGKT